MERDQIHIRGLHVHAPHGVYEEERLEGRSFWIDLDAYVGTAEAGESDDLAQTVDYRDLTTAILSVMEGPSRNLIEALAEEIADAVFAAVRVVAQVRVSVWKRALGVPGDPERVGVTIVRRRDA